MKNDHYSELRQKHFNERLARKNAQSRRNNRKPLRPVKSTKLDPSTISFDFN